MRSVRTASDLTSFDSAHRFGMFGDAEECIESGTGVLRMSARLMRCVWCVRAMPLSGWWRARPLHMGRACWKVTLLRDDVRIDTDAHLAPVRSVCHHWNTRSNAPRSKVPISKFPMWGVRRERVPSRPFPATLHMYRACSEAGTSPQARVAQALPGNCPTRIAHSSCLQTRLAHGSGQSSTIKRVGSRI